MAGKDSETEGLSEEERAALEEPDNDAEEKALAAVADEDDDKKTDDEDGEKKAETKAEDDEDVKTADEDKTGDDDTTTEDDDEGEAVVADDAFTPQLTAQQPEKFDERMSELSQKEADLDKRFEDDEIKWADYRKEQRDLQAEQRKLQSEKDAADFAEQQNDTINRQRWLWEVDRFMADSDLDYKGDEELRKGLDTAVRVVAHGEGAEKMNGRQILEEADAWVRAKQGIGKAASTTTTTSEKTAEEKKKEATQSRKPDLSVVPETLRGQPAAEENETGRENTKFAELDKLEGLEMERALAKLPKDEQDAYLRSTG